MTTSTIELIASDLLTKLQAVTGINPYRKCKARRDTPSDGDCEVAFETVEEAEAQYHGFRCLIATFSLTFYIVDGESDTTPIDGQLFSAWAAIHDKLMEDRTRNKNAINTDISPPVIAWGEENQMAALILPVRVTYRHPLQTMTVTVTPPAPDPDPTP